MSNNAFDSSNANSAHKTMQLSYDEGQIIHLQQMCD